MQRFVSVISGIFLVVLFGFAWGWLSLTFKLFPYTILNSSINDISAFIEGGEGDDELSIVDKLKSDVGGIPYRQLVVPVKNSSFNGCNGLDSKFSVDQYSCHLSIIKEEIDRKFSPAALVYGPFIDLRSGKYELLINQLSVDAPLSEVVGHVEVVGTIRGESKMFQRNLIFGTDGKNKIRTFSFSLPEDARRVEFKVFITRPVSADVKSLSVWKEPYWLSEEFSTISFEHKKTRRTDPQVIKKQDTLFDGGGLLFIFGAIDSKKSLHGGFFVNDKGEIVHTININDDTVLEKIIEHNDNGKGKYIKYSPMETRFPHGVEVLRDGGIIFNDGDPGNSIRRVDWCGNEVWSRLAQTHHVVSVRNNLAWHWQVEDIVATNIKTGEVEKLIKFDDVIYANHDIGGLHIRKVIRANEFLKDAVHRNDIEPLAAEFIDAFPQFSEGDLLISLRSLDMIAVLDPNTLKIKWWRVGATKRQHDPDWQSGGEITIFDNQMTEYDVNGVSRIVSINPKTFATNTIYSGIKHDAYTWMRGKHQLLPDGSILMSLPQQGRVILVNADGSLRFDFHNKFDKQMNLLVSDAIYLPEDYFDTDVMHRICE